jgi:hypothetical protein
MPPGCQFGKPRTECARLAASAIAGER